LPGIPTWYLLHIFAGECALKGRYGMEIRAATGAEAPGLSALFATAGHTIATRILLDRLDAMRMHAGAALVAVEWGPPSGVVVVHWYRTLDADQPTAQITTLFVAPDDRRRGIGRMLLKAAAQTARVAGCGALELSVRSNDPTLLAFCRATGFTASGMCFVRPLRKGG
jgi:aminoglycoside 6'-N-acetyltransferase I